MATPACLQTFFDCRIKTVLFQVSQLQESPVLSSIPVDDADFVTPADKSAKKRSNTKASCLVF